MLPVFVFRSLRIFFSLNCSHPLTWMSEMRCLGEMKNVTMRVPSSCSATLVWTSSIPRVLTSADTSFESWGRDRFSPTFVPIAE